MEERPLCGTQRQSQPLSNLDDCRQASTRNTMDEIRGCSGSTKFVAGATVHDTRHPAVMESSSALFLVRHIPRQLPNEESSERGWLEISSCLWWQAAANHKSLTLMMKRMGLWKLPGEQVHHAAEK